MKLYNLITLIAFLISLLNGFYIFSKNKRKLLNIFLSAICIIEAYWIFTDFNMQISDEYEYAKFWLVAGFCWPILYSVTINFVFIYTENIRKIRNILILIFSYILSFFFIVIFFIHPELFNIKHFSWGWAYFFPEENNIFIYALEAWVILISIYGMYICMVNLIKVKGKRNKKQALFFLAGYTIPVISLIIFEFILPSLKIVSPSLTELATLLGNIILIYAVIFKDAYVLNSPLISENIISTMMDSYFLIDNDFRIIRVNAASILLTGHSEFELLNMKINDILVEKEDHTEKINNLFLNNDILSLDHGLVLKSNEIIPVFLQASVIKDQFSKESTGAVIIIRNLTERKKLLEEKKKLQEDLLQIQKLEAVGQLASGIAHDFNNVLSSILLDVEDLKEKYLPDEKDFQETLENLISAINYANDLTKNILNFSRKKDVQKNEIYVDVLLNNVTNILKRTVDKNIAIKKEILSQNPLILGDLNQLQTVILNISINACDAMNEGGVLIFKVTETKIKQISDKNQGIINNLLNFILIEIIDSGKGMDENTKSRIFEPFFTTKPSGKGTGLGLSSAYGIIKNHNGFIEVESELNKGSDFKIYIPQLMKKI
jgi:PAS domain S-box-containing protein